MSTSIDERANVTHEVTITACKNANDDRVEKVCSLGLVFKLSSRKKEQ